MKLATAFFAGFFGVIAVALIFVNSTNTSNIISALGGALSSVGGTLASGGQNYDPRNYPAGYQFH